ncbi:MAG: hypothetical protein GVY27_00925 [Deinococcus-Thermus bacterium]|jgi:predicted  nucleic acid-binding Zn-ribbon protein|nr:hypothetical protein [Deinococcota bacterium]
MLERLSEVQERDLELDALDAERAKVPPELVDVRAEREALEARLRERRAERDELRARVRAADVELQALRERKKNASESSLRAESPKEAAQFQNQELQFATRAQELEEDTLPLMEELESLDTVVAELEGQLAEVVPRLESMEAEEAERRAEIDAREAELREARDALAAEVSSSLLRQYDQIRRSRRGLGLVELAGGRRCGGCNVQLPIHVVQKAKKGRSVVRCPACGRILWAKDGD